MFVIFLSAGLVGCWLGLIPEPINTMYVIWKQEGLYSIYLRVRTLLMINEVLKIALVFLYVYGLLGLLAYSAVSYGNREIRVVGLVLAAFIVLSTLYMLLDRHSYITTAFSRLDALTLTSDDTRPISQWWHGADKAYRLTMLLGGAFLLVLAAQIR